MFGRRDTRTINSLPPGAAVANRGAVVEARGGVSGGAILTGVVVAFGSMFLLSALVGGVLTAIGINQADITTGDAIDAGIGAGMALVVAQLLSYLWGGYTAGRMGRGAGFANGLLVPIVAILVAVLVGAVAAALGATANLNLPFTTSRLPLENDYLVNWGIGIGIASLVAMFLGGIIGGSLGSRWHTKLEREVYEEQVQDGYVATPATGATTAAGTSRRIDLTEDETPERHPTTEIRR